MAVKHVQDLPLRTVDLHSPIPLYQQIEIDLRDMITSGVLLPDDVLPPEGDLSRAYAVGRHTIRMALSRLVTEGYIARQPGRGTFVKYQEDRTRFYLDRSFTQQMAELGIHATSELLGTAAGSIERTAPEPLRNYLGESYFQLVRLRLGNGTPLNLQTTTILTERCPGIASHDFNDSSLYHILATVYHLEIAKITHTISAVTATADQAQHLAIQQGDPLLLVKTCALLEDGQLIEYTVSHYRADQYEYTTTYTYNAQN